jgi:hypothetical protein
MPTVQSNMEGLLSAEESALMKLVNDFSLEPAEIAMTISALRWFKEAYQYYLKLWNETKSELTQEQTTEAERVFLNVVYNLDRNSRSCFSKENFFGKVRFMLEACKKHQIERKRWQTYLGWLYAFPRTEEKSIKAFLENGLYPSNLPHVYMHMTAGFVRRRINDKLRPIQISGQYRTFQKELDTGKAHTVWFNRRFPGSYGSRK